MKFVNKTLNLNLTINLKKYEEIYAYLLVNKYPGRPVDVQKAQLKKTTTYIIYISFKNA